MSLITPFGACAALSLLLLFAVCFCHTRRHALPYRCFITFCALGCVCAFVLSRLLFALSNIPYYLHTLENPVLMLHFWDGGASLLGALLGVLLAALISARFFHQPLGVLMDGVALGAPLAILTERLAEGFFGNGMGMGKTIATPFLAFLGQGADGCHPVWCYEAIAAVVLLVVLPLSRRKKHTSGDTMLLFLLLYGCMQVVLESLRNDAHMIVIHFVRISQIGAIVLAVAAMSCWTVRLVRQGVRKGRFLWCWGITVACIGIGIGMEFAVDRLGEPLLAYSLMALVLAVIALCGLRLRKLSEIS